MLRPRCRHADTNTKWRAIPCGFMWESHLVHKDEIQAFLLLIYLPHFLSAVAKNCCHFFFSRHVLLGIHWFSNEQFCTFKSFFFLLLFSGCMCELCPLSLLLPVATNRGKSRWTHQWSSKVCLLVLNKYTYLLYYRDHSNISCLFLFHGLNVQDVNVDCWVWQVILGGFCPLLGRARLAVAPCCQSLCYAKLTDCFKLTGQTRVVFHQQESKLVCFPKLPNCFFKAKQTTTHGLITCCWP